MIVPYLWDNSDLEQKWAQYEPPTRSQQAPNTASDDTTERTKGYVAHGPLDSGLTNGLSISCEHPPLVFSIQFRRFISKYCHSNG